jgi:hypothetical protein
MKGKNKKLEYLKGGHLCTAPGRGVIRRALKHATLLLSEVSDLSAYIFQSNNC